jgi:hypothetical protein
MAQAMPIIRNNIEDYTRAATAAMSVLADINPTDPIEGMLVAQMIVKRGRVGALSARLAKHARLFRGSNEVHGSPE